MSFFARVILLLSLVCAAISAFSHAGEPLQDETFGFAASVEEKPEAERGEFVLGRREDLAEMRVSATLPRRPRALLDDKRDVWLDAGRSVSAQHSVVGRTRCSERFDRSDSKAAIRSFAEIRTATGRQSDP